MWALLTNPSHFLTYTPSQSLWDSPVIPQYITFPSKPFLNWYAKSIPVRQSFHNSADHLLLQAIFELTQQYKPCETVSSFLIRWSAPSSHFRTNMPIQAMWASPIIPQQITCPPSNFWTDTSSAVSQSHNSSSNYLPFQAIFELTHQTLWSSSIIPHRIHHSSMTPLA